MRRLEGDPDSFVDQTRAFGESWERRLQDEDPGVAAEVGNFIKFNLGSTEQRVFKMATNRRLENARGSLTETLNAARQGFLETDSPEDQAAFVTGALDAIDARSAIIGADDAAKQAADFRDFARRSIAEKMARQDPDAFLAHYERGDVDQLGKGADQIARVARAEQRRRRFAAEDALEQQDAQADAPFAERDADVRGQVYSPNPLTPDSVREHQNAMDGATFARANARANAPRGRRDPAMAARLLRERASCDALTQALAHGEIDDADAALIDAADDVSEPLTDLSRPDWLRGAEVQAMDQLRSFMAGNPEVTPDEARAFAQNAMQQQARRGAADVVVRFQRGGRDTQAEAAALVQRMASRQISRAAAIEQMRRLRMLREAQGILNNG